ncbi:MAG: L-rhamnose mutarotase [Sphingomonas sp.]|uniref:L-rhamnose mutarotase n=1 Tax=Sphingomonas sp. TaxID=28214 RepID=UPI001AC83722|nr:L-rhamnose mutarotase [Sphingomonas sp.]MBN8806803.1 L-rhamnose mutarotase [Sphingomonas sp.]
MAQHVLLLDLADDADLIAEYEAHHAAGRVWPEVTAAIRASGIHAMRIYRLATRLVMVMETSPDFSFEAKAASDAADPVVTRWETLMQRSQRALPGVAECHWQRAAQIFNLADQ